jgi:EmrB/QacA subfamily drug resistance transporter
MTEPRVGTTGSPPGAVDHRRVLVIFSGLVLAMLLAALDSTIVATALPTIVGELGGLEHLAWVVTAYLLAQTVVTPLYGKLGDLYGRKRILQIAIVIFLIGSALCGLSRSMFQLVVFRAVQGLGGGGLMVTTQAVIGDVVPARERGRYQGIFGAVFGVSSIAGPLLGGYFTTHLSWRWIFYVNLPVGIVALAVLAVTLPDQPQRVRRAIDYVGAALVAVLLSAIVLLSDLGGTTFAWSSTPMLGLSGIAIAALVGFLVAERRAAEPVLPLRLFRNRAFSVASVVGFVVGFAMFGSVTYLPVFLQVVKGVSPTASGLEMLPMMGGMLTTSITAGQIISRRGRYKIFPVIGTAVMSIGLFLISRVQTTTTLPVVLIMMLVLGLGLGLVMQVLVIAVQNAVDYADLGVATSGATLFRFVGGSFGTAMLGSIFASRLSAHLSRLLPAGGETGAPHGGLNPEMLARMPAALRSVYAEAFTASLSTVFLVAMGVAIVGFFFALMLPERPLRETIAATSASIGEEMAEATAMASDPDTERQLVRAIAALADRDVRRQHLERIVKRADVNLSAPAAWMLLRLDEDSEVDVATLARVHRADVTRVHAAADELIDANLIERGDDSTGTQSRFRITPGGCDVLRRLVDARRQHLAEVFGEKGPEQQREIAEFLERLAGELVPDARATASARRPSERRTSSGAPPDTRRAAS